MKVVLGRGSKELLCKYITDDCHFPPWKLFMWYLSLSIFQYHQYYNFHPCDRFHEHKFHLGGKIHLSRQFSSMCINFRVVVNVILKKVSHLFKSPSCNSFHPWNQLHLQCWFDSRTQFYPSPSYHVLFMWSITLC